MATNHKLELCSEVPVHTVSCTWTVRNWRFGAAAVGQYLESPTFESSRTRWSLRFYPMGTCDVGKESEEWASVYLNILNFPGDQDTFQMQIICDMQLRILDESRRNLLHWRTVYGHVFDRSSQTWGSARALQRNQPSKLEQNLVISCDIKMTVVSADPCTMESLHVTVEHDPNEQNSDVINLRQHLALDFEKLLDEEERADVVIEVEGQLVPAHRTILCARSPVFLAMLRCIPDATRMKEANSGHVTLADDVTLEAWKLFQSYLYTGSLNLHLGFPLSQTAVQVLGLSDMYCCTELRDALELKLCSQVKHVQNLDHLPQLLELSLRYGLDSLRNTIFYQISQSLSEEENKDKSDIFSNEGWTNLIQNRSEVDLMIKYLKFQSQTQSRINNFDYY